MKHGTRKELELLKERLGPEKREKLRQKEALFVWYGDVWVLREAGDGEVERGREALIAKYKQPLVTKTFRPTSAKPLINKETLQVRPAKSQVSAPPEDRVVTSMTAKRRQGDVVLPPAKQPPGLFAAVKSLWSAVSGGKTDEDTYQARRRCCFELGGYSYAPVGGRVESVSLTEVRINGVTTVLADDEMPAVSVDQIVGAGATIASGAAKKPCPYLRASMDKSSDEPKYFCGACGCGEWHLSELATKLRLVQLTCPRTPPLFTPTYVTKTGHSE
jgi:hypothetical protein